MNEVTFSNGTSPVEAHPNDAKRDDNRITAIFLKFIEPIVKIWNIFYHYMQNINLERHLIILEDDDKSWIQYFASHTRELIYGKPPQLEHCQVELLDIQHDLQTMDSTTLNRKLEHASLALIHLAKTNKIDKWNMKMEEQFIVPDLEGISHYEVENSSSIAEAATAYLIYGMSLKTEKNLNDSLKNILLSLIWELSKRIRVDSENRLPFEFAVLSITNSYLNNCEQQEREEILGKLDQCQKTFIETYDAIKINKYATYQDWKCGLIPGPKTVKECMEIFYETPNQDENKLIRYIMTSAKALQLLAFEKHDKTAKKGGYYTGFYQRAELDSNGNNRDFTNLPKVNNKSYLKHTEYQYIDNNVYIDTTKVCKGAVIYLIHGIQSKNLNIHQKTWAIFQTLVKTEFQNPKTIQIVKKEAQDNGIEGFNECIASIAIAYVNSQTNRGKAQKEIEKLLNSEQKKKFKKLVKFIVKK